MSQYGVLGLPQQAEPEQRPLPAPPGVLLSLLSQLLPLDLPPCPPRPLTR